MKTIWIFLKKWWKYIIIVIGAIFVIAYYLFFRKKDSKDTVEISTKLQEGLSEVKQQLQEVSDKAVVEVVAAKKEHIEVKKELKEIAQIKDNTVRRNRLASLAKRDDVSYD